MFLVPMFKQQHQQSPGTVRQDAQKELDKAMVEVLHQSDMNMIKLRRDTCHWWGRVYWLYHCPLLKAQPLQQQRLLMHHPRQICSPCVWFETQSSRKWSVGVWGVVRLLNVSCCILLVYCCFDYYNAFFFFLMRQMFSIFIIMLFNIFMINMLFSFLQ